MHARDAMLASMAGRLWHHGTTAISPSAIYCFTVHVAMLSLSAPFRMTSSLVLHSTRVPCHTMQVQQRPQLGLEYPVCVAWDVELSRWVRRAPASARCRGGTKGVP